MAIQSVRYLITDPRSTSPVSLLKGELLGVFGVYMTKYLSKPGQLTLSLRMNHPLLTQSQILDWTQPLKRSIWVYVDEVAYWGGFIVSRTYDSATHNLQIQASTFDAHHDQVINDNFGVNVTDSPHRLLAQMWNAARNSAVTRCSNGYPREMAIPSLPAVHGSSVNVKTPDFSGVTIRQMMNTCIDAGGEYRMTFFGNVRTGLARNCVPEVGMNDSETVMVGKNHTTELTLVLQYPGVISRYWWPETAGSGADAATYLLAYGKARDGTSLYILDDTVGGVSPTDKLITSRSFQINNAATSASISAIENALTDQGQFKVPQQNPTFEVAADTIPVVPGGVLMPFAIDVGDWFKYVINDQFRFPNVRIGYGRCTGISWTPPADDSPQVIGITMADNATVIVQDGQ